MADETDGESASDPAALRAGYEQLRERVLAGRPDGWQLGHAVLARSGLAGWIATWAALAPTTTSAGAGPARAQPGSSGPPAAGGPTLVPCVGEIVAVLSEMALAHAA